MSMFDFTGTGKSMKKIVCLIIILSVFPFFFLFAQDSGPSIRIKDLAVIQGVRENQLTGFGLVTGLSGRGDSSRSGMLKQVLANLFNSFGISVAERDIQSRNTALVMITATLSPFAQPGERIDVTVSSVQDAGSLEGGVLLHAPLQAANGEIYATVQGNVSLYEGERSPRTVGIVTNGGIVERGVVSNFIQDGSLNIVLRNPDFTTITAVASVLEDAFPGIILEKLDASRVSVSLPEEYEDNPIGFISEIEGLRVVPDYTAKVIINQKSGVVVAGRDVRIGTVAVSYKGSEIQVRPPSRRTDNGNMVLLEETATVNDFVNVMQKAGMSTDTIIEILRAIERSGALFGILEVM